jgi:hypothetical protein
VPVRPSAQLGRQSFSQNVPCPFAIVPAQSFQLIRSTPKPLSAQASAMTAGLTLNRNGGGPVHSATTPGNGDVTVGVGVVAATDDGVVAAGRDGLAGVFALLTVAE